MAEGFLGRWSQRKQALREGQPLPEPPAPPPARPELREAPVAPQPDEARESGAAQEPAPTLEDVQALTTQSDFTRYVQRDVDPEVKNAAMKKLFADPHFNVMDGMDVYIDDYSQPDPMPASMLRKLASAQFLKLFDDEKKDQTAATTVATAPTTQAEVMAAPDSGPPALPAQDHDHTDLRLQQDDAAGPQGSGRGPQ